jgi:AcrR family transcriptional regulator
MAKVNSELRDAELNPPPVTKAAIERRALILERAAQLFDESGYHNTTMIDIANSVGMRKPSLYHYYSNKDEILSSIHASFIDGLIEHQEARLEEGLSGPELVSDLLLEICTLIRTKRGHVRTFFEHHRELSGEDKVLTEQKRRRHRHLVQKSLESAIAKGELVNVDPEVATHAVLGMATWAYHWYGPEDPREPEECAQILGAIVLSGLLPAGSDQR